MQAGFTVGQPKLPLVVGLGSGVSGLGFRVNPKP